MKVNWRTPAFLLAATAAGLAAAGGLRVAGRVLVSIFSTFLIKADQYSLTVGVRDPRAASVAALVLMAGLVSLARPRTSGATSGELTRVQRLEKVELDRLAVERLMAARDAD